MENKPYNNKVNSKKIISQEMVENFSRDYKIDFPTAEKVLWMSKVLYAFSTSPIGSDFALMGGSAIVFLYKDIYRFSTDLDLDFIGNKMLGRKGKSEITRRQRADKVILEAIATDVGCQLKPKDQDDDRFVQYEMIYNSIYTTRGSVELDMSYRYCHSVLGTSNLPWPVHYENIIPNFNVQTLKQEELYASKVLAMMDAKERFDFDGKIGLMFKRKIRHLFDIHYLTDEISDTKLKFNIKMFHNLIILFGMTRIKNFQFFRANSIGSYNDEDIKGELRSVVPAGMTIPTAYEMKWQVRKFFDLHVFNWSEKDYRFIEDFLVGNFRPEDLLGDNKISKSLKTMQYYKEILGKVKPID